MRTIVKKLLVTAGLVAVGALVTVACENSKPLGPQGAGLRPSFGAVHPSLPSGVRIAGLGTLTTGGGTQRFDFDAGDDLTGRLLYTDSRFPGASLTVDADPATRIAAFQDGSRFCDLSHGAEFEGTGRREDGTYHFFTVAACDNGPAESGADFFRITTELVAGYFNEGFLASGDIVKTPGTTTTP
jgi:hypothetical protein